MKIENFSIIHCKKINKSKFQVLLTLAGVLLGSVIPDSGTN